MEKHNNNLQRFVKNVTGAVGIALVAIILVVIAGMTALYYFNKDNRLIKTSDKTYNPEGDCIRWEVHNKTTKVKIVETYQYTYDAHNNWVSALYFVNGSPTQIIERTLDYYE